jgi:NAD(P)H-hydrate repair Nnr-like enzyme with NAD(P)H-hydrate dehydratase domain
MQKLSIFLKKFIKLVLIMLANNLSDINYTKLIRNNQNTNKSTFGSVAIIGGIPGMSGAIHLAGRAALLLGSGKVTLSNFSSKIDYLYPELMFNLKNSVDFLF